MGRRVDRARRVANRAGRVLTLALLLSGLALPAVAQRRNSHRIIQLDEEVVEGRIEKPEAFYILQPANLSYESLALQESFIPELLRSVDESPF